MEIIRAAKQIKANKLPDSILAQVAASIIASSAQFSQTSPVPSVLGQKRHGSEKPGPPPKRQVLILIFFLLVNYFVGISFGTWNLSFNLKNSNLF